MEGPRVSAAREGLEEAGVVEKVKLAEVPIGTYTYDKRLGNGTVIIRDVHVFPWKWSGSERTGRKRKYANQQAHQSSGSSTM
jgi:hypothetical protein